MVAVLLFYLPAWHGAFVWDDDSHISTNDALRTARGLWEIWFQPGATVQYYPLTFSIFWLEYHLWGLDTLGYHLVNLLLHGTAAILLWQVLERLRMRGARLAGAIFALHPVCVMSVAWMTELKNTMSATLALCAAWAYLRATGLGVYDKGQDSKLDLRFYALSLAFFQLAMFSKTAVSYLPVTLLLVTWWQGRRLNWRAVWPVLPMFAIAVGMGLLTIHVERSPLGGATGERFSETFLQKVLISGRSFWFYLGRLFVPTPSPFIYERWNVDPGLWWQWIFPAATVALLAGAWWLRRRIGRGVFAALAHFYVSTSLLILIVVLYFTNFSFVSDHWQYFGCMSVIALVAAGIIHVLDMAKVTRWRPVVCGTLLLGLGILTWRQAGMYADAETLWRVTLERNPDCSIANNRYAGILFQHGRTDDAIEHLRAALRIQPDSFEARNNLGNALLQTGHLSDAVAELEKAVKLNPNQVVVQSNLRNAHYLLNLWELATGPDASARNGAQAVEMAEQANRVAAGRDPVVLAELAAAYAEAGRFPDAVRTAEQAVELGSPLIPGLAAPLRAQLACYQSGRAFRDQQGIGPATDAKVP